MPVTIKVQKDYYLTEVSVQLPVTIAEVDQLLRATGTNGKLVVLYNGGAIQGVNIEQKTKITEAASEEMRALLSITTKELDVKKVAKR